MSNTFSYWADDLGRVRRFAEGCVLDRLVAVNADDTAVYAFVPLENVPAGEDYEVFIEW